MTAPAAAVRPADWRAKAAVTLAQHAQAVLDDATSTPAYVTHAIVLSCCPDITDDAELLRLWEAYLDRVEREKGIEDGTLHWSAIDDSLTCGERTETAREIARQDTADALADLLGRQP